MGCRATASRSPTSARQWSSSRLIVARADTGELERFEGPTTGTTGASSRVHPDPAPPDPHLNRREPAAAPPSWVRSPMASSATRSTARAGPSNAALSPALQEGLRNAGRARADIHWNAWYCVAVKPDRDEALQDARATVAFYAQFEQYEAHVRRPRLR